MELPRTIRFDFLLILIGVGLIVFPYYFSLSDNSLFVSLDIIGAFMLVFGMEYVKYDYLLEMDLKELNYAKSKYALVKTLKRKDLISQKSENHLVLKIKRMLNRG